MGYRIFDRRFTTHWSSYITQSALASLAVLLALVVLRMQNFVVVASLAATAFTVFAMPHSVIASTRNVVGSHVIALSCGSLFARIPMESLAGKDAICALVVGVCMLLMAVTNTEHPPAAGSALGIVIAGSSLQAPLGVALGVGILAVTHHVLRPYMRDLIKPH